MLYHTWSHEDLQRQLEERRRECEHERSCAQLAGERRSVMQRLAERLGSRLVRVGTRLEQVGQPGALVNDMRS